MRETHTHLFFFVVVWFVTAFEWSLLYKNIFKQDKKTVDGFDYFILKKNIKIMKLNWRFKGGETESESGESGVGKTHHRLYRIKRNVCSLCVF